MNILSRGESRMLRENSEVAKPSNPYIGDTKTSFFAARNYPDKRGRYLKISPREIRDPNTEYKFNWTHNLNLDIRARITKHLEENAYVEFIKPPQKKSLPFLLSYNL